MTSDQIQYEATLYRPRESYKNFVISCDGVRIEFHPGFESGPSKLARELLRRGKEDGPLHIVEVNAKPGFELSLTLPSIFVLAEIPESPVPDFSSTRGESVSGEVGETVTRLVTANGVTTAAYNTLSKLMENPAHWGIVGGRTKGTLMSNGWVVVRDKTFATINDEGRKARSEYEIAKANAPVIVEADQSVTRGRGRPRKVDAAPVCPYGVITERQREALAIVVHNPGEWANLHGKTTNYLTGKVQWVVVNNGRPSLTDLGSDVAKYLEIIK